MAEPGIKSDSNSGGPAPGPSQNLAYDIDEISRVITVVYIGELTDAAVIDFYRHLVRTYPDAPDFDFLLDLRYTGWSATAETIVEIENMLEDPQRMSGRRVAVVRKGSAMIYETTRSELVRQGIGEGVIRYFNQLETAQDWLTGRRAI